jgi:uncharacterized RDD family membrane protein YckC
MEFGAPNMPQKDIQPEAPQKVASDSVQYAGFWIRFVAAIIDGVILGIVSGILFGVDDTGMVGFNDWEMIIPALYSILFWKYFAATPGKMALGLKVLQENGQNLEWRHTILRYIGYIPSTIVFLLGFIWVAFDKKNQGWHDKIAKTIVVKK